MKKVFFVLAFLCAFGILIISCKKGSEAQSVSSDGVLASEKIEYAISNNTVHFTTVKDYEKYLALKDKNPFLDEITRRGFVSILNKQSKKNNQTSELQSLEEPPAGFPDSVLEGSESFAALLNSDAILSISGKAYKLDWPRQKVFAMDASLLGDPNNYQSLNTGNTSNRNIGEFAMDEEVLTAIQEGYSTSTGINDPNRLFCWRRSGAAQNNYTPALYFFDLTWPESVNTLCANTSFATNSNTRLKVKLQYLKLGVYFHLFSQNKYQRPDGIQINYVATWRTGSEEEGEKRWDINYKAKWRGKCRNYSEANEVGVLRPPYGNDNQAARTFWESSNGLDYYDLEQTANIWTSAIWFGWADEKAQCISSNKRLIVNPARSINSASVYPFVKFRIRSGI